MNGQNDNSVLFRKTTVMLLTVAISVVFLVMIRGFLMALLLGAIFAGLSQPLYRLILKWFGNRAMLASITTLVLLILLVVLPLLALTGVVVAQAGALVERAKPWVAETLNDPQGMADRLPEWVPFREDIDVSGRQILAKLGEYSGKIGTFLVDKLTTATMVTAGFFLDLFVMLYAMFFFIKDGSVIRDKILKYLPLAEETKQRLLQKGLSVTRATMKGTLVIGLVQGALGGLAFLVLGIEGAAFWGTVMAVLSVIPGVGSALVWLPAALYLLVNGQTGPGVMLMIWGALVISSIDNVLRPRLVGSDTQMPDLLILVSTLGGLAVLGAVGLVVGPVIAALFVTIWDIWGVTFRDAYPAEEPAAT